jgi:pentapeptide repeat protein
MIWGVTAPSSQPDPPTPRPLSNWTIAAGALLVLAVAAVVSFLLLRRYGGQGAQVQLDAIRTAGTLVIGTGGAVALLLTARRQRYIELALVHTDRDATERRITELYTKAAELLGSDQAPVRLAGLYALERLAHSTAEHRQTSVEVICAYLRMPYTPPQRSYRNPVPARRRRIRPFSDRPPQTAPTSRESRHEQAQEEHQVRLTAQSILSRNLRVTTQRRRWWHRTPPPAPAWPRTRLDLTGALLLEFSLSHCQLDSAVLTRAQFTGMVDFSDAQFTGVTYFHGAHITNGALFKGAQFTDVADFRNAQFTGVANFGGARFGGADFSGAEFTDEPIFAFARVASAAEPGSVWQPGWTTRPAKPDNGEDSAFLYLTKVDDANPPDT